MKNKILWEGLGFPIQLIGFKTKTINGESVPDLNMKIIQETAFRGLIAKSGRFTGCELKFIRTYLHLTQIEFAKAINASDRSSISQWENKLDSITGMDINTEIMIRLFMAKQCEEGDIRKGIQDLVWYRMKDVIFDFVSKIKENDDYISISA